MGQTPAPVEFRTGDGITLRGVRWGEAGDWLIMVHDCDGESDLDSWRPLIPALGNGEWSILAIDLRGHGASEGEWTGSSVASDLSAAIGFARDHGAQWIALMAAGHAAVATLKLASEMTLDALVMLSPSVTGEEAPGTLRGKGEAKLFAVGGKNLELQRGVAQLRNQSIGWAMLVTAPAEAQGTGLLSGEHASQVRERIVAFLTEQRFLAKVRGLPAAR